MFKIAHAQFIAPGIKRFVIEAPRIAKKTSGAVHHSAPERSGRAHPADHCVFGSRHAAPSTSSSSRSAKPPTC